MQPMTVQHNYRGGVVIINQITKKHELLAIVLSKPLERSNISIQSSIVHLYLHISMSLLDFAVHKVAACYNHSSVFTLTRAERVKPASWSSSKILTCRAVRSLHNDMDVTNSDTVMTVVISTCSG